MFDHVYNLPKWYYPESLQEQRKQILIMFERNFADYLLKNPEIFDKLSEMMFNTCRPFEIFSLYFSWKSYLVMLKVYFENWKRITNLLIERQWEAIKQSNFASKLHMIKVSTLIIHGEIDELVPIQAGELLAHEIPNTIFVRLPKVGHM